MQLTYRGQAYSISTIAQPVILSEQEIATTYRGVQTTTKQYQFQTNTLKNPNWRTMRFLGKRYLAKPTSILGLA